ncbi:MAG: serine hydrolase domain-containing protein [Flavisolibacter sp.]
MRKLFLLILLHQAFFVFSQKKTTDYFPSINEWQEKPAHLVFDTLKLSEAIQFAIDHESKSPRNMELSQTMTFGKEPYGFGIGPFADRSDPAGLIIHKGYIIAKWGQPDHVEMTHSVTKSFLSVVVGLAVDKKIISSVDDTVRKYIPPIELFDPSNQNVAFNKSQMIEPFSSEHNKRLNWDVMLRQTSDWEGTLWGKPDWADRPDADAGKWLNRKRNEPGTVYEYNDVRVNALALAATSVWRRPLPQVLREYIMDPIGASTTWRWYGYHNSWIVLDGQPVQSVSGGGHWGGGMFINAYDMARFGLLTFHNGNWNGKQLISEQWIKQSTIPTKAQPTYGYMNFFLNTDKKYLPSAPASAFVHVGNGTNIIYVDKENDLVMVIRWIENRNIDEMVKKVLTALR